MTSNDKTNDFKNPVGPDQPLVRFDVPLWQVFVALFLIALVLTAFRWYERNRIAPNHAVHWQPFEVSLFEQEQRSRRNILVWLGGGDPTIKDRWDRLFESPEVRTATFLNRCLCLRIERNQRSDEISDWADSHLPDITQGGFAMFAAGSRKVRTMEASDITRQALLVLIEGE